MIYSVENLKISPETIDFFTLMDWTNEVYVEELLSPQVRRKYWIERMRKYPKTIDRIRSQLRGHKIFVSISIVPYQSGSTIYYEDLANIVVGPLTPNREPSRKQFYLLKSTPIRYDIANCPKTFLRDLFNQSIHLLWPHNMESHHKDVLLLITENCDSAFWRERLQVALEEFTIAYPCMIHQRSMLSVLKQLISEIRWEIFPEVNQLYLCMKNYLQFRLNASHFYEKTLLPEIPKEFIDACCYYAEYFDIIKTYWFNEENFDEYDDDYSHVQTLFLYSDMFHNLNLIVQNYSLMPQLQRMIQQKPTVPFVETMSSVKKFLERMETRGSFNCQANETLSTFMHELESKNSGYFKMLAISTIFDGQEHSSNRTSLPLNLSPDDIQLFRYAPIGGVTRQLCFPLADEIICAHLSSFPLRFIEYRSVNFCFGKTDKQEHKLETNEEDF